MNKFFALALYYGSPSNCYLFLYENRSQFLSAINTYNIDNMTCGSRLRWKEVPNSCVKRLFDMEKLINNKQISWDERKIK